MYLLTYLLLSAAAMAPVMLGICC